MFGSFLHESPVEQVLGEVGRGSYLDQGVNATEDEADEVESLVGESAPEVKANTVGAKTRGKFQQGQGNEVVVGLDAVSNSTQCVLD